MIDNIHLRQQILFLSKNKHKQYIKTTKTYLKQLEINLLFKSKSQVNSEYSRKTDD